MKRHQEKNDKRVFARVVGLSRCVPGRAGEPRVGDKVVLISLDYMGRTEKPLMLRLGDARKLAENLLLALAHHRDPLARRIVEEHFQAEVGGKKPAVDGPLHDDDRAPLNSPQQNAVGVVTRLPVTGLTLAVQSGDLAEKLDVLGGYRRGRAKVVLYRRDNPCDEPHDGVVMLGEDHTVDLRQSDPKSYLTLYDFARFHALPPGAKFRLGGRTWTKMTMCELRRSVSCPFGARP